MNEYLFMVRVLLPWSTFLIILISVAACAIPNSTLDNLSERNGGGSRYNTALTFPEVPSGLAEAQRLGHSFPSSDFYATGFYLPPETEATIHVAYNQMGSGTPRLLIGTYSRYEGKWNPTEIDLKEGIQTVTGTGNGGLLYIRYHASHDLKPTGEVTVEFMNGAVEAPYYKLGKTDKQQWLNQLKNHTESPDVILESERGMIVVSREHATKFKDEDQELLLTHLDEIIYSEAAISGLDDVSGIHQSNRHKVMLTETDMEDTYMAATWYRTWYHKGAIRYIMTVDGLQNDGWGPRHEIGHMHQQEAWTWQEVREVTVNIYALAAERDEKNGPSRLVRDNVWAETAVYFSIPDQIRDFNSDQTGYFVRLAMFHQLWLAFGDDFYHQLHRITREQQPALDNREEKMRYFMLQASVIGGVDLGDFFRKWGFRVNDSVYEEIAALNLSSPDFDISRLTDDPYFEFPEEQWAKVIGYSSEEVSGEGAVNGRADRVIDGLKGTHWHSRWTDDPAEFPHFITIMMNELAVVNGFEFTQRENGMRHVKDIEILVSIDQIKWESMGEFELKQTVGPQTVELPSKKTFRYIQILMKSSHDGLPFAALDEIRVY